jgi:hypothetical protein
MTPHQRELHEARTIAESNYTRINTKVRLASLIAHTPAGVSM